MDIIPTISEELIRQLDDVYPPITGEEVIRLSGPADVHKLIARAGQRSVVELLQLRLQQAKEDDIRFNV